MFPEHNPQNLIEVRDLVKYYPLRAGLTRRVVAWAQTVDGVSFDIRRGEVLGLTGESGCGKTSLARSLLRLTEPTSGAVFYAGANVFEMSRTELHAMHHKARIIDQDAHASFDPRLPVGKALAGFLALRPSEFVIADEPGSAPDATLQTRVFTLLKQRQSQAGLTCLLIAQSPALLQAFADRVGVMYLGKLVELAPCRGLAASPLHPYTQALLAASLRGMVPAPQHLPGGCRFHPRCPVAMDICSLEEPAYGEVSPGHWVACWRVQ